MCFFLCTESLIGAAHQNYVAQAGVCFVPDDQHAHKPMHRPHRFDVEPTAPSH
jgi:hypothetical protein